MKKNISYISWLQIIGPIFVVLGHSLNGIFYDGAWRIFSKDFIYLFHMPLFFMISGYLIAYTGWQKDKTYGSFVKGKALRLLLPYLVWNAIWILPKVLLGRFLADNVSLDLVGILKPFVYPRTNVWGHTWFLMGLFLVYLATPLWKKLFTSNQTLKVFCLVLGVALYCMPLGSEFLCISDLRKDLLFFMMGLYLGTMPEKSFKKLAGKPYLWIIFAVITSGLCLHWYVQSWFLHFLPCFFILMSLLSVSYRLPADSKSVEELAKISFGIYIMHWPVMLACRVVLYQILQLNVYFCIATMSVLGWIVPIGVVVLLRKLIPEKWRKPLQYLLGV